MRFRHLNLPYLVLMIRKVFLYVSDIYVFAILIKLNNAKFVMFVTVSCKNIVNNSSYMKFIWRKIYIYIIVYVNDIY